MISNSYNASCYIENNDGKYHMECNVQTDEGKVHSQYDGDNLIVGLNSLMDDIEKKITEASLEEKEQSPEEQIAHLQELVEKLQDENAKLKNQNYKTKLVYNMVEPKEKDTFNFSIFDDFIDKYYDKYYNYNKD